MRVTIKIAALVLAIISVSYYFINLNHNKIDINKTFEQLEKLDFSSTENPVIEKLEKLLDETKRNPESPEYWGKLGMNLFIHGYKSESIPAFKIAASLDEEDFRWTYFSAYALSDLNSDDAVKWYEKARELNSKYPPLSVSLGNQYIMLGELEKAEELFKETISAWKRVPHAYLGLAKIAVLQNKLDSAKVILNNVLQMAPSYKEAHIVLADVYRRVGEKQNSDSEIKIIEQLSDNLDLLDPVYNEMELEGVSSLWHQVRGDKYLKSGRLDKAVDEFKKVLEIKPKASFNNNLGNVYQKQNKLELAIEQYLLALKKDSVNIDALNNLGVVYFKNGKTEQAIFYVKKSLELNPESIDGYLNLGTFFKIMKQWSQSMHYFEQGMQIAPDDLRFMYQLSWLYASAPIKMIRDPKKALSFSKQIFNYAKIDKPSKYDLVAAALASNNQFQKAEEMAQNAYDLATKSGNRNLASEVFERLKLYKSNKPFRY